MQLRRHCLRLLVAPRIARPPPPRRGCCRGATAGWPAVATPSHQTGRRRTRLPAPAVSRHPQAASWCRLHWLLLLPPLPAAPRPPPQPPAVAVAAVAQKWRGSPPAVWQVPGRCCCLVLLRAAHGDPPLMPQVQGWVRRPPGGEAATWPLLGAAVWEAQALGACASLPGYCRPRRTVALLPAPSPKRHSSVRRRARCAGPVAMDHGGIGMPPAAAHHRQGQRPLRRRPAAALPAALPHPRSTAARRRPTSHWPGSGRSWRSSRQRR